MKNTGKNNKKCLLIGTLFALLVFLMFSFEVEAKLVFTTDEDGSNADSYGLDSDNSSVDFIDLEFGTLEGAQLRYDLIDNVFLLSHPFSFRLQNAVSDPVTCDTSVSGKMYHNTIDGNSYVCSGFSWKQIDGVGIGGGTDSNTFILDQDDNRRKCAFAVWYCFGRDFSMG